MSDFTPAGPPPDGDLSAEGARRRAAHRAPAKPKRIIVPAVIALAAVVALLVAFNSCSDPYDQGNGLVTPVGVPTPTTTSPSPSATTTPSRTGTPSPTTTKTTSPSPIPSKTATASPTPSPTLAPKVPVVVLNGTTTAGLAAAYAVQVRRAGWTVASTGNWRRTSVSTTTVFYPAGKDASARRLADNLSGSQIVRPALTGMSTSNLTVVVKR